MSYCTKAEVREMLKDDALNTIIGDSYIEDAAERETKIGTVIDAAIADAEGEIDGYLAKRYPVPIAPVPKVINKFAKDIAVYNLYSRIGINENGEEKNNLNRYYAAVKFLTLVAEGKVSLGITSDTPQASAATGFLVCSSGRLFSRGSMQGM